MRLLTGFFNDEDTGFAATLIAPQFERISEAVNRGFFDEYEYKLEAHLDEQGYASTVLYDWKGQVIRRGEHIDVVPDRRRDRLQSPLRYQAPPATFELWMFLLSKRAFDLRGSRRRYVELRPWLAVVGGVHVFHRGLRVHPYGDQGSDWLDLNLLRSRSPELRPSTNTSIGRLSVEDPDGLLLPKTDRMGFQENAAFIELRQFAKSATDWAARERKRIRDREQLGSPAPTSRTDKGLASKQETDPEEAVGGGSPGLGPQAEPSAPEPPLPKQRQRSALPTVLPERLAYRALATAGILSVASVRESVAVGDAGSLGADGAVEWVALGARAARPDKLHVAVRDLNEAIGDALSAVRGQLERHGISLTLDLCTEPVRVAAAASDLEAIVFNLALNAVQSFERAGQMLGGRGVLVRTQVDGGLAVVDFSDSGAGVDDVDLGEMWRPGVVGRSPDSTGLGLTIVRDAIADMRGTRSVDAYGELGGASFRIRLPLWLDKD